MSEHSTVRLLSEMDQFPPAEGGVLDSGLMQWSWNYPELSTSS
jgi:hypothetical protein